jgi:hypothetical protein
VTSHKAQGRTADEVIVCAAQLDAKATYVAFSRACQRVTGYTPDKVALFDALPNTNRPRVAALDIWTLARARRLVWARRIIERARQILAPRVPATELTVKISPAELTPKISGAESAPRIRPSVPRHVESPLWHPPAPPRQGMRVSM